MARTSRFLAPLLVMALLLSAVAVVLPPQRVSAQGEVISIENVSLQNGAKTVPIRVNGFTNLGSLTVTLSWDATLVHVALSQGTLPGGAVLGNPETNNPVGISYVSATGFSGNAILAYVTLTPLQPGGGTLDLTVTVCTNTSAAPISPAVSDGNLIVLSPTTVWVDDNWSSADPGDTVGNGYIYGYNAFYDIQEGVDAVEDSTVNVLPGYYSAFNITEDDIQVIGQDGAVVDSNPLWHSSLGGYYLAGVLGASNVLIQNLEFDGSGMYSCTTNVGVYCENVSSTTLSGLETYDVRDTSCDYPGYGIYVTSGVYNTVNIVNPDIYGCNVGIYVYDDTLNVSGGSIRGGGSYASYCSTGIWADYYSNVTVSGTTIYD